MHRKRGLLFLALLLGFVFLALLAKEVLKRGAKQGAEAGSSVVWVSLMLAALVLLLVAFALQRRFGWFVGKHFSPAAEHVLAEDTRRPILLLRSFEADEQFTVRRASWVQRLFGPGRVPLEVALTRELTDFGPVIAIGRPGEPLPPHGAARQYVSNDQWQQRVTEYVGKSQMVLVMLGETEGLRWEYNLLARKRALPKTVFVVPLVAGRALDRVLDLFWRFTDDWRLRVTGVVGPDVVLFAPGAAGELVPVHSPGVRDRSRWRTTSARHYTAALAPLLGRGTAAPRPARSRRATAADDEVLDAIPVAGAGRPAALPVTEAPTEAPSATSQPRWKAFAIDWVVACLVVLLAGTLVTSMVNPDLAKRMMDQKRADDEVKSLTTLLVLVGVPLFMGAVEGLFGNSIGKRLMGLRVVRSDYGRVSWPRAALRALVKAGSLMVSPCLCCVPLVVAFIWVPSGALHDLAADTVVGGGGRRR
jgi:uncharacterized RDD family membrane protein YckC